MNCPKCGFVMDGNVTECPRCPRLGTLAAKQLAPPSRAQIFYPGQRNKTLPWWAIALIISVIWSAVLIGIGIFQTNVLLAGKITQQQDDAISGMYGLILGISLGALWCGWGVFRLQKK